MNRIKTGYLPLVVVAALFAAFVLVMYVLVGYVGSAHTTLSVGSW